MQVHALSIALLYQRPIEHEIFELLPVPSEAGYTVFAESAHRWLPLRTQALIVQRTARGYVADAALWRPGQGALPFTLTYEYEPAQRVIRWSTDTPELMLSGEARFEAVSSRTCRLRYRFSLDLAALEDVHTLELEVGASQVVRDFRDYLITRLSQSNIL